MTDVMNEAQVEARAVARGGGDDSRLVWWDVPGTYVKVYRTGNRLAVRWPCDVLGRELTRPWESWTFPTVEDAEKALSGFEA